MASDPLTARSFEKFDAAVEAAVRAGAPGDADLARVLPTLGKDRQVMVAAALAECRGPAGDAALRAVSVREGASQDLRCAALLALAKRLGADASADLVEGFASRVAAVKDYALIGLAGAGDDRAWTEVATYLRRNLKRKRIQISQPDTRLFAIAYLAQHLDGVGGERTVATVELVRSNWAEFVGPRLDEANFEPEDRSWFERHWPEARPDGPPAAEVSPPDPAALREWVRHPLFDPLH